MSKIGVNSKLSDLKLIVELELAKRLNAVIDTEVDRSFIMDQVKTYLKGA